jgi:hypothetical protein
VLGVLRVAEVVRYQMDGRRNQYRLKHPSEVKGVLTLLRGFNPRRRNFARASGWIVKDVGGEIGRIGL